MFQRRGSLVIDSQIWWGREDVKHLTWRISHGLEKVKLSERHYAPGSFMLGPLLRNELPSWESLWGTVLLLMASHIWMWCGLRSLSASFLEKPYHHGIYVSSHSSLNTLSAETRPETFDFSSLIPRLWSKGLSGPHHLIAHQKFSLRPRPHWLLWTEEGHPHIHIWKP